MRSAVLFLIFNRPEPTRQVFEAIRAAQPPRLYVAADGARLDKEGEAERCAEVRRIATSIDWPCEIKTLFRNENAGCKRAVSSAITWFFEHEEQGIILEDDCLPTGSFFPFCDEILDRYKADTRIWQVSGSTFFSEAITETNADYFFTRYGPIWGWASWRRAWQHYDPDLKNWKAMSVPSVLKNVYSNNYERRAKLGLGNKLDAGEIDTWDYQWGFVKNYNHALTIVSKRNQILNIGFGADATHTIRVNSQAPKLLIDLPAELTHPIFMYPDSKHEQVYARNNFRTRNIIAQKLSKLIKSVLWRKSC